MTDRPESIGGIWIRQSKAGAEYFNINLGGKNYVAFANKYKSGNQPDYRIFASEERKAAPKQEPKPVPEDEPPF